jgi:hypothetical protein
MHKGKTASYDAIQCLARNLVHSHQSFLGKEKKVRGLSTPRHGILSGDRYPRALQGASHALLSH